jgi:hypothetical protein
VLTSLAEFKARADTVPNPLLCSSAIIHSAPTNAEKRQRDESYSFSERITRYRMAEQPQIKPEPDTGSPFMDEVDETPDLEFYDRLPNADELSKMYLTRLPNYLWEAWSQLDDDDEIEIGTIRQSLDATGKTVSLRAWRWPSTTADRVPI